MREVPEGYSAVDRQGITFSGRPTTMPSLTEGRLLVCEYVRARNMPSLNLVFTCDTIEDAQMLYDGYAGGGAIQLNWYITSDLVKILAGKEVERWLKGSGQ